MVRLRSMAAAAVTVTLVGTIGSGGASAGTHSLDSRVNELLSRMTLQESWSSCNCCPIT